MYPLQWMKIEKIKIQLWSASVRWRDDFTCLGQKRGGKEEGFLVSV